MTASAPADNTSSNSQSIPAWRVWVFNLLSFPLAMAIRFDLMRVSARTQRTMPNSLRVSGARKMLRVLARIVGGSWFLVLAFPIILMSILKLLEINDVIDLEFLHFQGGSISFFRLIGIPLALVGLVIPFLALAINTVLSRLGMGAVHQSLRKHGVVRLIQLSLVVLALEVLLIWLASLSIGADWISFGGVVVPVIVWWTIGLIAAGGYRISALIRIFQPTSAFESQREVVAAEAMKSLRDEVFRLLAFQNLQKSIEPIGGTVSMFHFSNGIQILAAQPGLVTDVSSQGIRAAAWMIRKLLRVTVHHLEVARPYTYVEKDNLQLASVSTFPSVSQLRGVTRTLASCFKIKSVKKTAYEADQLLDTLDGFKDSLKHFVNSDNGLMVRLGLSGYEEFFRRYRQSEVKLRLEDQPGLLGEWRSLMLILNDIADLIRLATKKESQESLGYVAHWIRVNMEACKDDREGYLFARLLGLYTTMFYVSLQHKNELGVHRSHFEPLQILDYKLFRFGVTEDIDYDIIVFHRQLGSSIISHFFSLLKAAVIRNELNATKQLLVIIAPSELFARFHPDLPFKRWDAESELQTNANLSKDRKRELSEQINICKEVDAFRQGYPAFYSTSLHGAIGYLIERIQFQASTIDEVSAVFKVIWNCLGDFESTQEWFSDRRVEKSQPTAESWDFWPDTRAVTTKDPMYVKSFVFVLRTLEALKRDAGAVQLPGMSSIENSHSQILAIAKDVKQTGDWRWLLGDITEEVSQSLAELVDKSRKDYADNVAKTIRDTPLSEDKLAEFYRDVKSGFDHNSSLVRVLEGHNRVVDGGDEVPTTKSLGILRPEHKEAYIEQDRISFLNHGEHYGQAMSRDVDRAIAEELFNQVPAGNKFHLPKQDLAKLLALLGTLLSNADAAPNLLLVPHDLELRRGIWSSEHFKPGWQLGGRDIPAFYGELLGIPIYSILKPGTMSLLALHTDDVTLEIVRSLESEVREYTQKEIDARLQLDNSLEEGTLLQQVWVRIRMDFNVDVATHERLFVVELTSD